jgi:hypothetical protein
MHVLYWLRNVLSEIGVNVPTAGTRVAQGPHCGNWRRGPIVGEGEAHGDAMCETAGAVCVSCRPDGGPQSSYPTLSGGAKTSTSPSACIYGRRRAILHPQRPLLF